MDVYLPFTAEDARLHPEWPDCPQCGRRRYDPRRFHMCGICYRRLHPNTTRPDPRTSYFGIPRAQVFTHLISRPGRLGKLRCHEKGCWNPDSDLDSLVIDHVQPLRNLHGPFGHDTLWNTQLLHAVCNNTKGARWGSQDKATLKALTELYYNDPDWWLQLEELDPRGCRLLQEHLGYDPFPTPPPTWRYRATTNTYGGRSMH